MSDTIKDLGKKFLGADLLTRRRTELYTFFSQKYKSHENFKRDERISRVQQESI